MSVSQNLLKTANDAWSAVPYNSQAKDMLGKLNAQRRAAGGEVPGAQNVINQADAMLNRPGAPLPDTRWQAAGATPIPAASEPPLRAVPQSTPELPMRAIGRRQAGGDRISGPRVAPSSVAPPAAAGSLPYKPYKNPYDDPNYDRYVNPGFNPIKQLINAARPVRKVLHPALYSGTPVQEKKGGTLMPIDSNLLQKVAKVYEAAEAVDGMKPKEVYESHKKCAPGEFGMNKEGASPFDAVKNVAGSLNKTRLNTAKALGEHVLYPAYLGAQALNKKRLALGKALGERVLYPAAAGAQGAYNAATQAYQNATQQPLMGKASAFHFGGLVKQALDPRLAAALSSAAGGALGGAGLGGLYGLVNPGEYEDESGNKKRRGRLMGALRGAGAGGALGGAAGGAFGAVAPETANALQDKVKRLFSHYIGEPARKGVDELTGAGAKKRQKQEKADKKREESKGSPTMSGSLKDVDYKKPSESDVDYSLRSTAKENSPEVALKIRQRNAAKSKADSAGSSTRQDGGGQEKTIPVGPSKMDLLFPKPYASPTAPANTREEDNRTAVRRIFNDLNQEGLKDVATAQVPSSARTYGAGPSDEDLRALNPAEKVPPMLTPTTGPATSRGPTWQEHQLNDFLRGQDRSRPSALDEPFSSVIDTSGPNPGKLQFRPQSAFDMGRAVGEEPSLFEPRK